MTYQNYYDNLGGEVLPFERRFLFEKIVHHRPKIIVEIGSGSAGSTRIILLALEELNQGTLYNCDPYNNAVTHITDVNTSRMIYQQITGQQLIQYLIDNEIIPDFVFFDGPEEPDLVLRDFQTIDQIVQSECVFISHDWEYDQKRIDGNISIKSKKLKPYLHEHKNWVIAEELSGIDNQYPNNPGYHSVGMVYAIKV